MTRSEGYKTSAFLRYLEGEWLRRGLDQTSFLERADISPSWASNLRADTGRSPALAPLAKLRKAYGLDINLMTDILEGRATVDANGRVKR